METALRHLLGHRLVDEGRTGRARMEQQDVAIGGTGGVHVEVATIRCGDHEGAADGVCHRAILATAGRRRTPAPATMDLP